MTNTNTRKYNSFVSVSNDYGVTWSKPIEGSCAITGDRHILKYANDGRLLCTFRDTNPISTTYGDWILWIGEYRDVVSGKNGQYRIRLKKNYDGVDCGYSGIELHENGDILVISYGHWTEKEPPYIISVKLNLEEIDNF